MPCQLSMCKGGGLSVSGGACHSELPRRAAGHTSVVCTFARTMPMCRGLFGVFLQW